MGDNFVSTDPNQKEFKEDESKPETIIFNTKQKVRSLEEICIDVAKRMNKYPYISTSFIKSYDDANEDPKVTSNLVKRLRLGFIMSGRGDVEEFRKLLIGAPIVYVQAHEEMPTLAADGCYNNINVHGKPFKTFSIAEYPLADKTEFEPFIIVRGADENGKPTFGKIVGNPYHDITKGEAEAVMMALQSEENK